MGIKGLLPLLAPIARPVSLDRYRGLTAAVDAMAWLHRGIYAGDVRSLAHSQHAERYEMEVEEGRSGEGGEDCGGRFERQQQQQRQDDDAAGVEAAAEAAGVEAATEQVEAGPSRRIDFDRALEADPAAASNASGVGHGYNSNSNNIDGCDGGRSKYHGRPRPAAASRTAPAAAARPIPNPSQTTETANAAIISYVLRQSTALLTQHGLSSLVLLIDGDSLPSKAGTNAARSQDRWRCYREAREAEARGEGSRTVRKLYAQSCGITHEMRRELVERIKVEQQRGRQRERQRQGERQKKNMEEEESGGDIGSSGTIDYLVAPYEADAQMAQLAHAGIVDVVITEDSDLLAYGCPRVVFKVDLAEGRGQEVQLLRDLASMGGGTCGGAGHGRGTGASGRGRNGGRGAIAAAASSGATGFNSSSVLSFQNWTHDMFVYMCILSGCDYCDGVPGVGIKTAHKLVRMYRTPAKIFKALRAAGRMPRPRPRSRPVDVEGTTTVSIGFEESFWTAYRTFRHQTVYNPATGRAEPLLPIVEVASVAAPDWDAVGPMMESEMARGIATGRIHPAQRIPWETVLAAATAAARTRASTSRANARSAVPSDGGEGRRNRYPFDQPLAARRQQLPSDATNRHSPSSAGRTRQALANSKDLFRFFARKPKESRGSDGGGDFPRASPSSRGGRNSRPPLREIFVNTVGNDGRKGDDSLPSLATSVTNQRDKCIRGGGGGHQPIPIHFGDYSSALVGTTFQPLSRQQNNRADTSAAGGVSSRNISRAVQCLKANAAKARVIKYRGRSSPKGGRGDVLGIVGSEKVEYSSSRLARGSSTQSVQSAPHDRVGVKENDNESTHNQVFGRSSLDAHRNYCCDPYLGGEDLSMQYYSQVELDREFVDEGTFDLEGHFQHYQSDHQNYGNYSEKETYDGGYDRRFLEHGWSEGLGDECGTGYDAIHRQGTARAEREEMPPVDSQYQEYFHENEALEYDESGREHESSGKEAFGKGREISRMDPRDPSIDSANAPNDQKFEVEQWDRFHDEGLLRSQNSPDDVDGEYGKYSREYGRTKMPEIEVAAEGSNHHFESEHLPLDVSISSPQLKRQNLNATPDFRNAGHDAFHHQGGHVDEVDHQFPLDDCNSEDIDSFGASRQYLDTIDRQYDIDVQNDEGTVPVDQEMPLDIGTEQVHDSTLDPDVPGFSIGDDYY